MKFSPLHSRGGFSLILCLIILSLLAILTIAFLSSSMMDRATAHAFSSKAGAEIAADTAVNQAISMLTDRITQYPDSVTVWQPMTPAGGGNAFEGTVLCYSDVMPNDTTGARHILPLASLGLDSNGLPLGDVLLSNSSNALGSDPWNNDNSIDMNRPRYNGDTSGWIGAAPSNHVTNPPSVVRRPYYAKWNNVQELPVTGKTPRTIGRYAFWMEDESFKLNLNTMNAKARAGEANSPGAAPTEIPFQGLLRSADQAVDFDSYANAAYSARNAFFGKRLFDTRSFNQLNVSGASTYNLGDQTKFFATVFSGGLNLSRHGSQRLNVNGLGIDQSGGDVMKQVKQIVETVRYHAPNFGQRFYRLIAPPVGSLGTPKSLNSMDVAAADGEVYLYKIAANIRDFIDPDLQPTIIIDNNTLAPKGPPKTALNDDNTSVWAQGKENGPFLQEAVCRYRTSVSKDASGNLSYDLKVDYYIEFWNMSTDDIYAATPSPAVPGAHILGSDAFVRISGQQGWQTDTSTALKATNSPSGDPSDDPTRDLVIDLNNGVFVDVGGVSKPAPSGCVVFKAGQCTVITTDPDYIATPKAGSANSEPFSGTVNLANTYYCSNLFNSDKSGPGKREYTGPLLGSAKGFKPEFRDGTQDYETEVILGNSLGLIESNPFAVAMGGSPVLTTLPAAGAPNPLDNWYGGSLFGNSPTPSELGDPRTNNEQLVPAPFKGASTGEPDQTRYFNTTAVPRFSLGYPNDTYVNPQLNTSGSNPWPDYYKGWTKTSTATAQNPNADTAPMVVANANLNSSGQLGDVFDPARVKGTVGTLGITASRGGGRTFRIGQKDDLADMSQVESATGGTSQEWASWRLPDFLSTTSNIQLPGLININGLRRDNGAALRAAAYGISLNWVSCSLGAVSATVNHVMPIDSTETASNGGLQHLIAQAITRLSGTDYTKPTYFRERGEISDLAIYSSTTTSDLVTSGKMSEAFDHTREELVRRLMELITTRGNIFSVYAIGESVTQGNDKAQTLHVTGIHEVKVTFALIPKNSDGSVFQTTQETFDPTNQTAIKQRFAKPDHYDVQFLQVAYPLSHP